jgi:RecJ-like exonuclease
MPGTPFERTAAVFTEIGAISPEDAGRRVRIMGYVVDTQSQAGFILGDETGSIAVAVDTLPKLQAFVRVIGSIAVSSDGRATVRAEVVQDLAGLDKQLFKRAMKLVQAAPSGRKT